MAGVSPWTPGQLPGTPREWLAGPDWCFTDGSAAFASASSQSLRVASNSTLQTGNVDFWLAGWMNLSTLGVYRVPFSKFGTAAFNSEYLLDVNALNVPRFLVFSTGATKQVDSATTLTASTWAFVIAYHDSVNDTVNISVNGSAFASATTAGVSPNALTAPLNFGTYNNGGGDFWNGRLASWAFGKSPPGGIAAIATTIRDRLYASGAGIVYADTTAAERTAWGLVSWWDLVRSGVFTDSHGTNNLTNNNGVTFGAGLPRSRAGDTDPISAWVDRWQGTTVSQSDPLKRPTLRLVSDKWRVRFDGVNDLMSGSLSSADVQHSVWASATLAANGTYPMLVVTRSELRELRAFNSSRQPEVTTDSGVNDARSGVALTLDIPVRLIGTYGTTGGATTLYQNGVLVATDAADSSALAPNAVIFGSRAAGSNFWAGDIASAGVAVGQTLPADVVAQLDAYLAGVM